MFPADVGFFENVAHVVFVEIVALDRYCAVCLRVVVDIMIGAVSFKFITGSSKLSDRLDSWIHYVSPLIEIYTMLRIMSRDKYTKIRKLCRGNY